MRDYCQQNKAAWEYNAYDFWVSNSGQPSDRAKLDLENPLKMLKNIHSILILMKALRLQIFVVHVVKRQFLWLF